MELIIVWTSITITIGYLKFNNEQYIALSIMMFFVTYLNPTTMSLKNGILISIIPNAFFWYLAYNCNNFLWFYPYEKWLFVTIFLIYSYILIYIFWEWS